MITLITQVAKEPARRHTTKEWQSWDWNSGLYESKVQSEWVSEGVRGVREGGSEWVSGEVRECVCVRVCACTRVCVNAS